MKLQAGESLAIAMGSLFAKRLEIAVASARPDAIIRDSSALAARLPYAWLQPIGGSARPGDGHATCTSRFCREDLYDCGTPNSR